MDIFTSVCCFIALLLGVRLWFYLMEAQEQRVSRKRVSRKRAPTKPRATPTIIESERIVGPSRAKLERLAAFDVAQQLRGRIGVESNALYTVTTITQGPDIPPTQTQSEPVSTPTRVREQKRKEEKKEPEPKRSFFDRIRDDDLI